MVRRFGLSLLIILLALAATVYPRQDAGVSSASQKETRKSASRVDGSRVERRASEREPSADDAEDGRNVYTDDDVLKPERRDARLNEVESLEMQCFNEVNRVRVGHKLMA